MSTHRPQFARVPENINVSELQKALVVVIGVGMVGSQIAEGLARFTVGNLRLIDHERYEWENTLRHALPVEYDGWNKAIALREWLPKQIEGLHVEAIPHKVDDLLADEELDRWLVNADLVVAATDDRSAQRRIGRRALEKEVAAIFPAVYPHQGGGEVILQLDYEWPCFGCWDYFRPNSEALRGVRALDLGAQPVIFQAEQFCLGYLDPGSEQDRLLRPERAGEPPEQFVMIDAAGVPSFGSLTERSDCPSCSVAPPAQNPEARQAWEAAQRARAERRLARQATRQPGAGAAQPASWGSGAVVIAILLALLVGVIGLVTSGSGKQTSPVVTTASVPTKSPQEVEAETAAKEQAAAKRIAQLRVTWIKRYICQLAIGGENSLPLYIEGMDEHLQDYLAAHGYTDLWTNSAHTFSVRFIEPGHTKNNETYQVGKEEDIRLRYVATITAPTSCGCESVGSGLLLEATTPIEPEGVGVWTVFWQLKNRAGQVVKRLHYTVNVDNCETAGSGEPTPCGHSIDARYEEWPHLSS